MALWTGWRPAIRRTLWLLGVVALLLTLLPEGLRWGALYWLRQQPGVQAELTDIDLNLFTGRLTIEGLRATREPGTRLACQLCELEINWRALWQRRLELQQVRLQQVQVDLLQAADKPWIVGIFALPAVDEAAAKAPPPAPEQPWGFGVNGVVLTEVRWRLATPALQTDGVIEQLTLSPTASWNTAAFSDFNIRAQLHDARLRLAGKANPLHAQPTLDGQIAIENFQLAWLQPLLPPDGVAGLAGRFDFEAPVKARYGAAGLHLSLDGALTLRDLQARHPEATLHHATLSWQGPLSVTPDEQGRPVVQVDGALTLDALDTQLSAPPLRVREQRFQWRGSLRYPTAQPLALQSEAALVLQGLQVSAADDQELLSVAALSLPELAIDRLTSIQAAELTIDGLHALKSSSTPAQAGTHALGWQQLRLDELRLSELNTLTIEHIRLQGVDSLVALAADRQPEALQLVETALPVATPASTAEAEAPAAGAEPAADAFFRLRIGGVEVVGDNRFVFQDNGFAQPTRLVMQPFQLTLGELDSARPQQATPLSFSAGFEPAGQLHTQGQLYLFAARPTLQLNTRLQGFELLPFDPYTRRHIGYRIKSGQLNLSSEVALQQGILDSSHQLLLQRFQFAATRPDQQREIVNELGMPPGVALSLLRDRQGDIELEIPVTGDINDPHFGIAGIVNKALLKGVKVAILNYYSPLLVVTAADALLDLAEALRFEPVAFAAGRSELAASQYPQLDTMAKLLRERPGAGLTLCGVATKRDLEALQLAQAAQPQSAAKPAGQPVSAALDAQDESDVSVDLTPALEQLAQARSRAVRRYLIDVGQVSARQLYQCNPELELASMKRPRVEVSL